MSPDSHTLITVLLTLAVSSLTSTLIAAPPLPVRTQSILRAKVYALVTAFLSIPRIPSQPESSRPQEVTNYLTCVNLMSALSSLDATTLMLFHSNAMRSLIVHGHISTFSPSSRINAYVDHVASHAL